MHIIVELFWLQCTLYLEDKINKGRPIELVLTLKYTEIKIHVDVVKNLQIL